MGRSGARASGLRALMIMASTRDSDSGSGQAPARYSVIRQARPEADSSRHMVVTRAIQVLEVSANF